MRICTVLVQTLCWCIIIGAFVEITAQPGIDTLGWLPGGSNSQVYGVSPDGVVVCGSGLLGVTKPIKWTSAGGLTAFAGLPGGNGPAGLTDAALGGVYFSGWATDAQNRRMACRWNSVGDITELGFLPGGTSSSAVAISEDGSALCGGAATDSGLTGFYWTQAGGIVDIGNLPGGSYYTDAEDLSGDGNVVVGWSRVGPDNYGHAFSWTSAGGMVDLGTLPGGYTSSIARGVSIDGSVIVGSCTRNDSVGQTIQAFRWTAATGMQGLGWMPGGRASHAYYVSGDGTVIIGNTDGTTTSGWFIWREAVGMMDFADFLQNEYGVVFNGWTGVNPVALATNGKTFVGNGRDANNRIMGWRVKLSSIVISDPEPGTRYQVGRADTIRWTGPSNSAFRLEFSPDDGNTFVTIKAATALGDSQYVWRVPKTLRSGSSYRIRVSNAADPAIQAISGRFTVKGYDLARVLPDGTLKVFEPNIHGWAYLNTGIFMWPPSWWQQFDYIFGNDPYTGKRYPDEFTELPVNALPWQMPDWPLFVEAFSTDQCYWSTIFAIYKNEAVEYWRNHRANFLGSCYGFAVSSSLAFNHPAAFFNRNPEIPQVDNINALPLTDFTRKAINREWTKQYAKEVLDNDIIGKPKTPRTLLREVKQLFLDETQSARPLSFFNNGGSGAHTVLPYLLVNDQAQANLWRLFVYDSNNPSQLNRFILIDSTANTWTDMTGSGWGTGNRRCYLEPPSDLFVQTVHFQGSNSLKSNDPMVRIFTGVEHETVIENPAGETIGYQDSSAFNTFATGIAIIPKVGTFAPPIGYYLPADRYSAKLFKFSDSLASLSVYTDSLIHRYSRADAGFSQQDEVGFDGGLSFRNPDAFVKRIELTAIARQDSSERRITISSLQTAAQDSLHFSGASSGNVTLANIGTAKQYDLRLSRSAASGGTNFEHLSIALPSNAAHQVVPVWEDLNQPVIIYIDFGNDGTIDDSTTILNQAVGINNGATGAGPGGAIPGHFVLKQNYPNPFNPQTTIRYAIPVGFRGEVELIIYNVLGKKIAGVREAGLQSGWHEFVWDGLDDAGFAAASGVYIYRLTAGAFVQSRKMLLVR